ncbi:hypothetical protein PAECIP111893_04992 [Paenibacillus plantiphilus]|uniref:TATA-box binding n=1 Tax=Paenibacillus plantiphilus TaxID=2905650 RepID=A0ABN8H4S3_9BACL|nr:YwmB family TATA-box binding protein [Paenibacillus plantiphilus]CAH1223523.1 hypothetical protein PAECIP111893_04992 [Paenibacillus plantiphilus]
MITMDTKAPMFRRAGKNGIIAVLLVIIIAGGLAVWKWNSPVNGEGSPLLHDFKQLWTWSDGVIADGAQGGSWSFRWDGSSTYADIEQIASQLNITLEREPQGLVYRGNLKGGIELYTLTIWAKLYGTGTSDEAGHDNAIADVVLLLNGNGGTSYRQLLDVVSKVEETVSRYANDYEGSFAVRGLSQSAGERASDQIAILAQASALESYEDGGTRSVAYYSAHLKSLVHSGKHKLNLQIAEHVPPAGSQLEIIIGVPLITGDYSAGH